MRLIGPNFLAQGWDTARRQKGIEVCALLKPAAVVVFNNDDYAIELALLFPEMLVIARLSGPDHQNDDNIHTYMSPLGFVGWRLNALEHAAMRLGLERWPENVAVYVENETAPTPSAFQWLVAVGKLLVERGVKGVLGNWANTWPTVEQLLMPVVGEYLQLLADHRDLLFNGVHEYGPHDLSQSPAWFLGVYVKWIERARDLEIPPPNIVVTEFGWDGDTRGIRNAMDEMAEQAGRPRLAGEQVVTVVQDKYRSPYIIGLCFFSAGDGLDPGRWRVFDALEFGNFWEAIATGLGVISPEPVELERPEVEAMQGQYVIGGLGETVLNVRDAPGGTVVGTVADGDVVVLTGSQPQWEWLGVDDYLWREIGAGRWIAMVDALALAVYEAAVEIDLGPVRAQLRLLRVEMNDWVDGMLELLA